MSAVASPAAVFERIVCAVDGRSESAAAASQAAALLAEGGTLELVCPAETHLAAQAGYLSRVAAQQIDEEAEASLAHAAELAPGATGHLVHGHVADVVLGMAAKLDATLVAVGAPRPPRARDRVLGSLADAVVRRAGCSVLVARRSASPTPRRIVCGVDGSPESFAAAEVAVEVGRRCDCPVELVAGLGGKAVVPRRLGVGVRLDPRPPVDALVDASLDADLVVVGNRGLHGLFSLGSVSARVAARADCSVLVVRSG